MPSGSWLLGSNPMESIGTCTVACASAMVIAEHTFVMKPDDAGPNVGAAPWLAAAAADAGGADVAPRTEAAELMGAALLAAGVLAAGVLAAEVAVPAIAVGFARAPDPPLHSATRQVAARSAASRMVDCCVTTSVVVSAAPCTTNLTTLSGTA